MTGESLLDEERRRRTRNGGPGNLISSAFLPSNITHLKLSGSGLSQLPAELPPLECIVEVDLSRNQLKEVPGVLCSLKSLCHLNLSSNQLTDVPMSLCDLKNLRHLNLSNNKLDKVPEVLYQGLHVLKTLNLSGNQLLIFPRAPLCLPILQNLDLSNNRMVTPPPWILDDLPSSLFTLDMSHNVFTLSPGHFQDASLLIHRVAENVKTLILVNCGLRGATEKYISNFKNVVKLDIGNEEFRERPNFLTDLSVQPPDSMQELSMRDIGLGCLPKCVTTLPNLRKLELSNNEIHWLPPTVSHIQSLTVLRASNCKIYLVPPEMNLLTNIKELYLSDNELSCSDGFEKLASLEVLDLYQNQFYTIPDFKALSRLRALDFCQNFTSPPQLVFLENSVMPYSNLCECFRSGYAERGHLRTSGSRVPRVPEIEDERCSNYSDSRDCYFDSDFELEEEEEISSNIDKSSESYSVSNSVPPSVVEVWEVDNDDNYDPNEVRHYGIGESSQAEAEAELTGQTCHEVKVHPHYFIPFRSASPTVLPTQLDPPQEGQFDSD